MPRVLFRVMSGPQPVEPPLDGPGRTRARVSIVGTISFVVCVFVMFAGMATVTAFVILRIYDALT